MDVFLSREAWTDIEALGILRPPAATWGLLLGHLRGVRRFVEKAYPAGGAVFPSVEQIEKMNTLWEGKLIGFFSVRPDVSFKKALLGPAFFGKIFLDVRPSRAGIQVKSFIVEYTGSFFYSPIPLESGSQGAKRD